MLRPNLVRFHKSTGLHLPNRTRLKFLGYAVLSATWHGIDSAYTLQAVAINKQTSLSHSPFAKMHSVLTLVTSACHEPSGIIGTPPWRRRYMGDQSFGWCRFVATGNVYITEWDPNRERIVPSGQAVRKNKTIATAMAISSYCYYNISYLLLLQNKFEKDVLTTLVYLISIPRYNQCNQNFHISVNNWLAKFPFCRHLYISCARV